MACFLRFTLAVTKPLPRFSVDPYGWFAKVRTELAERRWAELLEDVEPSEWTDEHGHTWRTVRTSHGIEIRPELSDPSPRVGDSLRVTAIAIGEEIEVELTARSTRWADRFSPDSFDIAAVGQAMLDQDELPHDNLPRLFPRPMRAE
ncbi:MAG TPA: hypothetical protein VHG52_02105 [Thermomicrobiales bacterium]|nr:hypothetical protein [Thermomicrobiales bacterium]